MRQEQRGHGTAGDHGGSRGQRDLDRNRAFASFSLVKELHDRGERQQRPEFVFEFAHLGGATQLQRWVNKVHEARGGVCVDGRMFTIVIRAGSAVSRVDWRADYPSLSYEWVDTPPEIEKGLQAYLATMGLTYAAVDFAIDAHQRWI